MASIPKVSETRTGIFSYCDCYLWGNLNRKVYKNNSFIIKGMKKGQTCAVTSVHKDELQKVTEFVYML
jgi:hypothetical protein